MFKRRSVLSGFAICVVALGIAASCFALGARGQRAEGDTAARWEYLIVAGGQVSLVPVENPGGRKQKAFPLEATAVERNLDVLGEEGWELVATGGAPSQPTFFLKRARRR